MLTPEQKTELLVLRGKLRAFGEHLETAIVHEESRWLAVEERLGREARDGDPVTAADEQRAGEIMRHWTEPLKSQQN
jgi:hypothetical protein